MFYTHYKEGLPLSVTGHLYYPLDNEEYLRYFTTSADVGGAMSRDHDYETELTASRNDIAAVLSGVADGVLAGSIQLGDGADAVVVETPDELTLEIELETEDDELSLEFELEWSHSGVEASVGTPTEDLAEDDDSSMPVRAANASQMLARFEVFRDQADEWRWRLRHRNGNIIATSGEGYTRKHNAQKGLQSVVQNAPDADVTENFEG